jgi:hypothetical protein
MSVKDIVIPHIRDYTTSKETWTTLKDLYDSKNTNRVMYLKSKLISTRMEENESISDFISRIKYIKDKLGNICEIESISNIMNTNIET